MIVVRFKVRCQEGSTDDMVAAIAAVSAAARGMDGVAHFDIGRDITDSNSLIATEVFEDRAAMEREEALPEVARVVELLQSGGVGGSPGMDHSRRPNSGQGSCGLWYRRPGQRGRRQPTPRQGVRNLGPRP